MILGKHVSLTFLILDITLDLHVLGISLGLSDLHIYQYLLDFRQTYIFNFPDFRHLEHLPDLLHSADVELRIEAGETIALLYELAREEDEVMNTVASGQQYIVKYTKFRRGSQIVSICVTVTVLALKGHDIFLYRTTKEKILTVFARL